MTDQPVPKGAAAAAAAVDRGRPRKRKKIRPASGSEDSQPIRASQGRAARSDDDHDEIPRTNRGPMIIGGVAGGLTSSVSW